MKRTGALLAALLLAACGGGGGGSHTVVPTAALPAVKGSGNVQFSVNVPVRNAPNAKSRTPKFVSPATQSVSVTVAGSTTNIDVVSGSPGCVTNYAQPAIVETQVNLEPRGIVRGPNGNIWFVEDAGGAIGEMAPGNAYVDHGTGVLQNAIIVGPDGNLWIANVFQNTIGVMTTSGAYSQFGGFSSDFSSIVQAADHTVWATSATVPPANVVYHIAADGSFLSGDTITLRAGTTASVAALGPDGAIYVTEIDGTNGWVARIALQTGRWTLTNEFPLPGQGVPIVAGPDNALWTVDTNGAVYRMTTAGTVTNTYHVSGFSESIIAGSDGALWIAEYSPNKIARVTTAGTVNEYPVPTAASSPFGIAFGADGVYFTEDTGNKVGRINFPVACTATAAVPAGSVSATVTAYDATGGASGTGTKLSVQTLPITIVANTNNSVNVVLNGIVKSVAVSAAPGYNSCNSSGTIALSVQAQDASGNAIIGPGNYADAAGNALTLTLTTDDSSGHSTFSSGSITSPGAAPALNWTTGFLNSQTIGATVSGGSITGTITPAVINGGCS